MDEKALETKEGFTKDFEKMEEIVYTLLCKMRVAMLGHKMIHVPHITRAVMDKRMRDMSDNGYRHNRDFIIVRDFGKILYNIRMEFQILHKAAIS